MPAMAFWEYLPVGFFAALAVVIPILTFFLTRLLRPSRQDPRAEATYECGSVPEGEARIQFHFQYYMFAILFVAFDLVTVFVLLWALLFVDLGELAKLTMVLFLGILLVGVAYALKKEEVLWI